MRVLQTRVIPGPNIYHHQPVLVMTLDLEDATELQSAAIPGFAERLAELLPGLRSHRCSPGREGGFLERLGRGTYFAHIIEHIALELSELAGIGVDFGKSAYGGRPGLYEIVLRCRSEKAMSFLARHAVFFTEALLRQETYDLEPALSEARLLAAHEALGPSTKAIVDAAVRRGIPWIRLSDANLIQFGYGKRRRLIEATSTDATSSIAVDIAQDKDRTKRLLAGASLPIPRGETVYSEAEAVAAFRAIGAPVAVKPRDGHQGKGVSLRLASDAEVSVALRLAAGYSDAVLVEEIFEGNDYRVLVVAGHAVAAARRTPAHVTGDGVSTVRALVDRENQNPLRGEGHEKPLSKIVLDGVARDVLRRQNLSVDSVPADTALVFLRDTANISTGGTAADVTDDMHPSVRNACERAARLVGLDICGVDLILKNISRPLEAQQGGILEVNASPGIRMHHRPSEGKPRDAGQAIVDYLYPPGVPARIPIVAVTGTNGKTTVTRLLGHILSEDGRLVGMTTSDGIHIGGERVASGDTAGPASALTLLRDPEVEAAVLETARGGIARRGLAYDFSDVAVITNIQPDHIGQDGIENLGDILNIKRLLAERVREGGALVLNADDPLLERLPEHPALRDRAARVIYFSLRPASPVLRRHLLAGGAALYLKNGWLLEASGPRETPLIRAADVPLTFCGTAAHQCANALAALAAYVGLGCSAAAAVEALASFHPNLHNLGRGNLYRIGRGHVLVDYAHNPEAIGAVAAMASQWNFRRLTAVIAAPGDRSDELIRLSGRAAARGFDRLIIREDKDLRGRMPGETADLLARAAREEDPEVHCVIETDSAAALERAIEEMSPAELVVYLYDELEVPERLITAHAGAPVHDLAESGVAAPPAPEWLEAV